MTRKYYVRTPRGGQYHYGTARTHEQREEIEQEMDEAGLDYFWEDK